LDFGVLDLLGDHGCPDLSMLSALAWQNGTRLVFALKKETVARWWEIVEGSSYATCASLLLSSLAFVCSLPAFATGALLS
jgi:hypothetical protein